MNNLMKPLKNLDFEKSILCTLMLVEPSYMHINGELCEGDFYDAKNKVVFRAAKSLFDANDPINFFTVQDYLNRTKMLLSAGGDSYLAEIATAPASFENLSFHVERIKFLAAQRRIKSILEVGHLTINDDSNDIEIKVGQIVSDLLQATSNDAVENKGPVSISSCIESFLQHQQDLVRGITPPSQKTGFLDLDIMAPIQKGNLVVLAARPAMGKTTLAMNALSNIVRDNRVFDSEGNIESQKLGVIFSLEMTEDEIFKKFIAAEAGVDLVRMIEGRINEDEWASIQRTIAIISDNYPLYIDDQSGITYQQIRARLLKLRSQGSEIGVVVIDYLQIMAGLSANNMTNDMSEVTKNIKSIAKEFDCPVILLSQLNRDVEKRPNKRPVMADLRSSGSIEQDADIVMFVYRDEYYNQNSDNKGASEIIVGKNRHGKTGTVILGFDGSNSKFSNFLDNYVSDDDGY